MKNLLVYGLQRSGTNFLESLLTKNFKVRLLNSNRDRAHPKQKHFRLYDDKRLIPEPQYHNNLIVNSLHEFIDKLNLEKEVEGIIVISKDPVSWLLSYQKWAEICNWPEVEYHYVSEYMAFYGKWIELAKQDERVTFVKYMDLLKSTEDELEVIREKYQLKRKLRSAVSRKVIIPNSVPFSPDFNSGKRDYYTEKKYLEAISAEELTKVKSLADHKLLKKLGYGI